ncbi:uncharacterized protein LOC135491219 [Lineus longissimus]|uniref:uncharacterized protein LOC135491219 n=1 Tax=Lineus longissimus TaxID=88925 RepID=UPI00315C819A
MSNLPGFDTFLSTHAQSLPNMPCPLTRTISPELSQAPAQDVVYGLPIPVAPGPYPTYDLSNMQSLVCSLKQSPRGDSNTPVDITDGSINVSQPLQSKVPSRINSPAYASSVRSASSCSMVSADSYATPLMAPGSVDTLFSPGVKTQKRQMNTSSDSLSAVLDEVAHSEMPISDEVAKASSRRRASPKRKEPQKPAKKRYKKYNPANLKQELPECMGSQFKLEFKEMKLVCYCTVCRLSLMGKHELMQHEFAHVRKSIEVMERNCPVWLPAIHFLLLNQHGVISTHQQSAICQEFDTFLEHFIDVHAEEKPRLDRYVTRIKEMLPAFPNADPAWYAFRCMETDCHFESNSVVNVALHFLRVHNPFMPYCCLLCGEKALIMADMVMHMLHTHFSPAILQEIGIWEDSAMSRHLKLVAKRMPLNYLIEGFTNVLKGPDKERRCMLCCKFSHKEPKAMVSHILIHFAGKNSGKPFVCLLCSDPFFSDEDLKVHIYTNHLYDQNYLDAVSLSDNLLALLFGENAQPKTLVPEIGITKKESESEYNFWKLQEFTEQPHCSCSLCSFVTIGRVYKKLKIQSLAARQDEEQRVVQVDLLEDDANDSHLIEGTNADVYTPIIEQWAQDEVLPIPLMGAETGEQSHTFISQEIVQTVVTETYQSCVKTGKVAGHSGSDVWQVFLDSILPADANIGAVQVNSKDIALKKGSEILSPFCNPVSEVENKRCDVVDEICNDTSVVLQSQQGISESKSSDLLDSEASAACRAQELGEVSRCPSPLSAPRQKYHPDLPTHDQIMPKHEIIENEPRNQDNGNDLNVLPSSQVCHNNQADYCPASPASVAEPAAIVHTPQKSSVTDLLERIGTTLANLHQKEPVKVVCNGQESPAMVTSASKGTYGKKTPAHEDTDGVPPEKYFNSSKNCVMVKAEPKDSDLEGMAGKVLCSDQEHMKNSESIPLVKSSNLSRQIHLLAPDFVEPEDSVPGSSDTEFEPSFNGLVSATRTYQNREKIRSKSVPAKTMPSPHELRDCISVPMSPPKFSPQSKVPVNNFLTKELQIKISPLPKVVGSHCVAQNSKVVPAVLASLKQAPVKDASVISDSTVRKSPRISSHSKNHLPILTKLRDREKSGIVTEVTKQVQNLVKEYLSEARMRKRTGEASDPKSERGSEIVPKMLGKDKTSIRMIRKTKNSIRGSFECVEEVLPEIMRSNDREPRDKREAPDMFNDRNVLLDMITTLTKGNLNKERLTRYNLATPKFTAMFDGKTCTLMCDCGCGLESLNGDHSNLLKHICQGSTLYTCGFCRSVSRTAECIQTHLIESHGYPKAGVINGCRMYHDPMNSLMTQVVNFTPKSSDPPQSCSQRSPPLTTVPMVVAFLQAGDTNIKKIYCSRCGSPFVTLQSACQHVLQVEGASTSVEVLIIMVTQTILTVTPDPKLRMIPVVVLRKLNYSVA